MNKNQCVLFILSISLLVSCTNPYSPSPQSILLHAQDKTPLPTSTQSMDLMATITPPLSPTITYTPSPTPSPTAVPWTLDNAISKLPEVYTKAIPLETVKQYSQLLSLLTKDVQLWITGMGWGLEDLVLDDNEVALLETLSGKNTTTAMSIMTSPRIINGANRSDVTWAQDYDAESLTSLLQDDIDLLLENGLLSDKGFESIKHLIKLAESDFEITKGLFLMASYGVPDNSQFTYVVPDYNVVMYIFGKLADNNIPEGYELVALATAFDYGALYTIGNNDVKIQIIDYANSMVSFVSETDQLLMEHGADWRAKKYSLEANINLVWGAPGKVYPWTQEKGWWDGWNQFNQKTMEQWEFDWLFIDIPSLTEMRNWIINEGFIDETVVSDSSIENDKEFILELFPSFYNGKIDIVMALINDYFYIGDIANGEDFNSQHFEYQFEDIMIDVDGVQVHNHHIANPDWQWEQFQNTGKLIGNCVDNAYMEAHFAKSINISSNIMARMQQKDGLIPHVVPIYLSHVDSMWRATVLDAYLLERSPDIPPFHYGISQIPLSSASIPERVLFGLIANSEDFLIQSRGIPGGYIFRRAPILRQPGT